MPNKTEGPTPGEQELAEEALRRDYPPFADAIRTAMAGMDARVAICVLADIMAEVAIVQSKTQREAKEITTSAANHAAKGIARRWETVKRMYLAPEASRALADKLAEVGEGPRGPMVAEAAAAAAEAQFAYITVKEEDRQRAVNDLQNAMVEHTLPAGIAACADSLIWYISCLCMDPNAAVNTLHELVRVYTGMLVESFPAMKAHQAETMKGDGAPENLAWARPAGTA